MNFLYSRIIIGFLIFFFPFNSFASQCDSSHIAGIFTEFEQSNYWLDSDSDKIMAFYSSIELYIWNYRKTISESDLESMEANFKTRQDDKFKLALYYFYENIDVAWLDKFVKEGPSQAAKEKFGELKEIDFYSWYYWEELIEKSFIPSSYLTRSLLLDWMIYSCELWKEKNKVDFSFTDIDSILDSKRSDWKLVDKQMVNQKKVIKIAVWKYQSLVNNYRIHKKLESIQTYLEKLRLRMADLAIMVWYLPAKLVWFGFENN